MWPRRALLSAPVTAEIAEIGSNNSTFASGVASGESGPGNQSIPPMTSTLPVGRRVAVRNSRGVRRFPEGTKPFEIESYDCAVYP